MNPRRRDRLSRMREMPSVILLPGNGWATISLARITTTKKSGEAHEQGHQVFLRLGRGRRRRADDLRRVRLDAVARGIPAADFGGDGLVAQRRLGSGNDRLSRHGTRGILLGRAV